MRKRLLVSWGALLFVGLVVLGCDFFTNNGSTTTGTTGLVFVLNSAQGAGGIGSISGYLANISNGSLSALVNSPFGVGSQLSTPNSMSADALGRFVFVSSNQGSGGINGYVISQDANTIGQLDSAGITPTIAAPAAIAEHPSAGAVYAVETTSTGAPQIEGFGITGSGTLTAQAKSPYSLMPTEPSGVSPTSVTVAASGGLLWVGMNNGDIVSVPINSDGTLSSSIVKTAPLAGVTNVAALTADPTLSFLYAVDGTQFVSLYGINRSTGALTAVSKLTVESGPVGVGVASVNGTPTYVFTANRGSSNVAAFVIGSGGALTGPLLCASCALAVPPLALAVDPSNNFLYVAGGAADTTGSVLSFVIVGGTSTLSPSSTPSASTGTAPTAVVAVPCAAGPANCS